MESVVGNSKNLFDTKTLKQHKMQVQISKQILKFSYHLQAIFNIKFLFGLWFKIDWYS